jgi:hypothetical protein
MTPVCSSWRRRVAIGIAVLLVATAAIVAAQAPRQRPGQIWNGGFGFTEPPRFATRNTFAGGFNFCRLAFSSNRREKRGWSTDYPGADINLSVRLGELTKARITRAPDGEPEHIVVRPTDDALFNCGFVMIEDGGTAVFSPLEAERLRSYLLKGGFIFASDYWGSLAKEQLDDQLARVLPRDQYPIVDIPMSHPIWHTLFDVNEVQQNASLQYWLRSGGGISERGGDSRDVTVRGISDDHGRLMVVLIHNSDIPDPWEREGADEEYFYKFSPGAYAVGINIVLYALTH